MFFQKNKKNNYVCVWLVAKKSCFTFNDPADVLV